MATASGKDIKFDIPLSNLATEAFAEGVEQFVADQLFPSVNVARQSDKYYTITKNPFLRVPGTTALRAPGTSAKKIEWEISSDSFFAKNYALSNELPLEDLANADIAVGLRENSTRLVVNQLRRDQEVRIANMVTSISNMGSGVVLSGTTKWSNYTTSDPIAAVNTGHAFIRQTTGLIANTLLLDYDTMQIVRRHPVLLDLYKYTQGGQLTNNELASVFGVSNVLIGMGIKENQIEGASASSITNIWSNCAILAYVAGSGELGLQAKSLGVRFQWRDPIYPSDFGVMRKVMNEAGDRHVEIIEAGHFQDEKIIAPNLGYAITSTL